MTRSAAAGRLARSAAFGICALALAAAAGGISRAENGEAAPAPAPAAAPAAPAAPAAAPIPIHVNLNITPKRLTFARGQRVATAHIFNRGDAPATFDIALVDRVMLENGEIRPAGETAADPAAARLASARDMIVVSPRRVTLAPGRGQTIRIRVTAPATGTAAEYRTHLTVTTLPPPQTGLTAEDAAARRNGQLSFHVNSVFGVSIPLIVRPQPVTAEGAIRNVRLAAAGRPALTFELARTGTGSLFGNVEIRSRARGRLGSALGLGVYTEVGQRNVTVPLQRRPAPGEELEIAFLDDDATPGRAVARTTFRVP